MNKKGQINSIFNSRTLVFIFGGAILGFMISKDISGTIIGAIIGGLISFFIR